MSDLSQELIQVQVADTDDRYNHVFLIRTQVFVDEESVDQEDEYDGFDHLSTHFLATYQGKPVGTARRRRLSNSGKIRLERFAVLKEFRRKGVGTALAQTMLADISEGQYVFVHAQVHAITFFESLGFAIEGETFEEAGIQHIKMVYQSSV